MTRDGRSRSVPWVGVGLVALSATAFGAMALFARIAYDSGADVLAVLAARFALAAPVLWVLVRARRARAPRGRTLLVLAVLGGVGYVGQSLAYFSALTLAPASLVALLLYLYPGFVTVLSVVTGRERWSRTRLLALGLATAGAALVIGVGLGGDGPTGGSVAVGAGLAVTAAVVYAGYILLSEGPTARAGALASSAVVVSAAALVLTTAAVATGARLPGTASGWLAVVAIALVSTVVAVLAFFAGLARLGPTTTATLSTLEPVVTVVLAAVVLDEVFTVVQAIGGALVLTAVLVLVRGAATRPPSPATTGAEHRAG